MKVKCLHCGHEFELESVSNDSLGWYTTCPKCEGSFDVDLDDKFCRNKVQTMWENILEMLPHQPRSFDTSEDTGYWTNGSEILCSSELEREIIADFLEDIFSEWGGYKMKTGYYDPFEDVRNGEQDDNTGFYYIDMEE